MGGIRIAMKTIENGRLLAVPGTRPHVFCFSITPFPQFPSYNVRLFSAPRTIHATRIPSFSAVEQLPSMPRGSGEEVRDLGGILRERGNYIQFPIPHQTSGFLAGAKI